MIFSRVADLYQCNADPDPAFHINTDPGLTFHFNADPDPVPYQSDVMM